MTESHARVGEQRPGGRAERVRNAVLEATAELLTEVGYDQLTIDEVAARAGVHKTTVYRRWPTKPELITAAASAHSEQNVPIPDTGTLLGDLEEGDRGEQALFWVLPPDQGLERLDLTAYDVDDWLKESAELLTLNPPSQVPLEVQAGDRLLLHHFLEDLDLVAPPRFGSVHGRVRCSQKI